MVSKQKREFVFLILSGIFISNALLAELIGGKLVGFAGFTLSLGVIQWPIVFITTDLINEYFGKRGVRNLSIFTAILIGYAFLVLYIGMQIPAVDFSPVKDDMFSNVFGQSMWIIVGSLAAFLLSQGVDVAVFWLVRARTEGRMLWLRSTGSTVVSQIVDTYVVLFIAFYLPGQLGATSRAMTLTQYIQTANSNYIYKMLIAIAMTPFIYIGHNAIERVLGHAQSEELMKESARESLKEA
jgi:uncharacterized integral membrane protein (TIGR00697 family)